MQPSVRGPSGSRLADFYFILSYPAILLLNTTNFKGLLLSDYNMSLSTNIIFLRLSNVMISKFQQKFYPMSQLTKSQMSFLGFFESKMWVYSGQIFISFHLFDVQSWKVGLKHSVLMKVFGVIRWFCIVTDRHDRLLWNRLLFQVVKQKTLTSVASSTKYYNQPG